MTESLNDLHYEDQLEHYSRRLLVGTSQGRKVDRPPKNWIPSELEKLGVLGVKDEVLPEKLAYKTDIFHDKKFKQFSLPPYDSKIRSGSLQKSMQLASQLLRLGLPYMVSINEYFKNREKDPRKDPSGSPTTGYGAHQEIKILLDPTPQQKADMKKEFNELCDRIKWVEDAEMWEKHGMLGTTQFYQNEDGNVTRPIVKQTMDMVRESDDRRPGLKYRNVTIALTARYADAISRASEGSFQRHNAQFHAAVTIVREIAHAFYWFRRNASHFRLHEPYIDDYCGADIGQTFVAYLFHDFIPEPIASDQYPDTAVKSFYTGLSWRHWPSVPPPVRGTSSVYPHGQPDVFQLEYSCPVSWVRRVLDPKNWQYKPLEDHKLRYFNLIDPTLHGDSGPLRNRNELPRFQRGRHARRAIQLVSYDPKEKSYKWPSHPNWGRGYAYRYGKVPPPLDDAPVVPYLMLPSPNEYKSPAHLGTQFDTLGFVAKFEDKNWDETPYMTPAEHKRKIEEAIEATKEAPSGKKAKGATQYPSPSSLLGKQMRRPQKPIVRRVLVWIHIDQYPPYYNPRKDIAKQVNHENDESIHSDGFKLHPCTSSRTWLKCYQAEFNITATTVEDLKWRIEDKFDIPVGKQRIVSEMMNLPMGAKLGFTHVAGKQQAYNPATPLWQYDAEACGLPADEEKYHHDDQGNLKLSNNGWMRLHCFPSKPKDVVSGTDVHFVTHLKQDQLAWRYVWPSGMEDLAPFKVISNDATEPDEKLPPGAIRVPAPNGQKTVPLTPPATPALGKLQGIEAARAQYKARKAAEDRHRKQVQAAQEEAAKAAAKEAGKEKITPTADQEALIEDFTSQILEARNRGKEYYKRFIMTTFPESYTMMFPGSAPVKPLAEDEMPGFEPAQAEAQGPRNPFGGPVSTREETPEAPEQKVRIDYDKWLAEVRAKLDPDNSFASLKPPKLPTVKDFSAGPVPSDEEIAALLAANPDLKATATKLPEPYGYSTKALRAVRDYIWRQKTRQQKQNKDLHNLTVLSDPVTVSQVKQLAQLVAKLDQGQQKKDFATLFGPSTGPIDNDNNLHRNTVTKEQVEKLAEQAKRIRERMGPRPELVEPLAQELRRQIAIAYNASQQQV